MVLPWFELKPWDEREARTKWASFSDGFAVV